MALRWKMRDAGGGTDFAAKLVAKLLDPTAGSEDAELQFATLVAGTLAARLILGQGLYTPNATGGDKGGDTINAQGIFQNGVPRAASDVSIQSGTAHSPTLADHGKTFIYTNAAGCTVTLPGGEWALRRVVNQGHQRQRRLDHVESFFDRHDMVEEHVAHVDADAVGRRWRQPDSRRHGG